MTEDNNIQDITEITEKKETTEVTEAEAEAVAAKVETVPSDANVDAVTSDTKADTATSDANVDAVASDTKADTATSDANVDAVAAAPDTRYDKYAENLQNAPYGYNPMTGQPNPAPYQPRDGYQNGYNGWTPYPVNGNAYQNNAYQNNAYQNNAYQNNAYQNNAYGNGPYPGNAYQGNAYQGNAYQGNAYQLNGNNNTPKKQKKKHHMPLGLKIAFGAVAFGIIAAASFTGTNYLLAKFDIAKAKSQPDTNVNIVQSTPLLTDVNPTPTDVSSVVEKVSSAIVQISCTFNTQSFFGVYQSSGAGSGIVIKKTDTEVLIATNNHVIENATSINVTFVDGTEVQAITKGTDPVADLGVIAVKLSDLSAEAQKSITVATLGSSDDIKVGEMVIAIGNALGYGQTTTVGYVSAKNREVTKDGNTMLLLQTDAAINPGNSGGALINTKGEVIGIPSIKYTSSSIEGIGFAIPISRAQNILNELAAREVLSEEEKGYLGITFENVTSAVSEAYGWPVGVYVASISEGYAADKAGLQIADIITAVDGTPVTTGLAMKDIITGKRVGTTIVLTVQRRQSDGTFVQMEIEATLTANPSLATRKG